MKEKEMVNHPEHYNELLLKGKPVETIDLIKTFSNMEGVTPYRGFLMGNIIKYLSRYPFKDKPEEDLEKADWYLQRLIEEVKNENNRTGI